MSILDKRGHGKTVCLQYCHVTELFPVKAVTKYLAVRGDEAGPLFRHSDGAPLTKNQFWVITAKALGALDLQGVRFGMHSFKIEATSIVAAIEYHADRIQKLGRWRSGAYKR